jgi:hypothetical protein
MPNSHVPPAASRRLLGTIPLASASPIEGQFQGAKIILKLPGGQIYIEADMDIDADGSPRATQIDPGNGQLMTSLQYSGVSGQAKNVNSEVVPYFVLPGNRDHPEQSFFRRNGIKLGDIAAVIFKDKIEYAIFADVGPQTKMGEGSIALAQSLGHNPFKIVNGKPIVKFGIPKDVIYIIFPQTRVTPLTPGTVVEKTRQSGKQLFINLGGAP